MIEFEYKRHPNNVANSQLRGIGTVSPPPNLQLDELIEKFFEMLDPKTYGRWVLDFARQLKDPVSILQDIPDEAQPAIQILVEDWDLEYSFQGIKDGVCTYVHEGKLDGDMRQAIVLFKAHFKRNPRPEVPPQPISIEEARKRWE